MFSQLCFVLLIHGLTVPSASNGLLTLWLSSKSNKDYSQMSVFYNQKPKCYMTYVAALSNIFPHNSSSLHPLQINHEGCEA